MKRQGASIRLAAAALLPSLLAAMPGRADIVETRPVFVPPGKPMVLTRLLRRSLSDGREVVSMRSYLVQFRVEGERIRIDGLLLAVTVDAPPSLAPLVDMERRRTDDGMFPMWLDRAGMLLPRDAAPADPARRQAIERTAERIGAFGLAAGETAQALAFVAGVEHGNAGATSWPSDLFRPAPRHASEVRAIALPGGGEGQVTVDTEAALANGMLAAFTRKTITNIAGDRRVVTEQWTLVDTP